MKKEGTSTRRAFLGGGAILAVPVAAVSIPAAACADDRLRARAARLENEAAIRELHQSWLRRVNRGERTALLDSAVRRIVAHPAGAPDKIDIALDGLSAVGRFDSLIESETPLPEECTLARMAHAQGLGAVCRAERCMMTVEYTKAGGAWKIARVVLRSA